MASTGNELDVRDRIVDRQHVSDDDTSQDEHVRSWLHATSPAARDSWLLDDNRSQAAPSPVSHTSYDNSQPEAYELIQHAGIEPPPYTVHDPAKDQPAIYKFELDDDNSANAKLYVPLYLRTWMFILFTFIFAVMLIVVEVLWQITKSHHGLSTQSTSRHYLWTYGPTLFITIVAAFWGQVEYRVKQLTPWKAMTKGPVPAEKVLLIDYVSTWNVAALITASKAKHYAVSLAITASLLIQLAIVVSTALFSLESERMFLDGADIRLRDTFTSFSSDGNDSFIQPVLTVVAVTNYNLSYPPGTAPMLAIQTFQSVHNITDPSTILFAEVDVFSADLECDMASVSHVSGAQCAQASDSCDTLYYNLTVTSSTGCMTNTTQVSANANDTAAQYYGSITAGSCYGQASNTDILRYTIVSGHQFLSYDGGASNASHSTALICRPTYQVCRSPVAQNLDGSIKQLSVSNTSCSSIADVSDWDIASSVMDSLEAAAGSALIDFTMPDTIFGDTVKFDTFFAAMDATSASGNITGLLDISTLYDYSRQLYSNVAAQIAKLHLTMPSGLVIKGTLVANQERLYVQEVPLRILEAISALLICIALVALLLRPSKSTPSDVSTISGLATVLSRSPRTTSALSGLGTGKHSELSLRLTGKSCYSTINTEGEQPIFTLTTTASGGSDEDYTAGNEKTHRWQPFSMTIYARIGLVLLPLILIATLEAVYQHSAKEDGLGNVDEPGANRYSWTLVPAFIMTITRIGFHMVDFNTRLLQPYDTLRKGQANAERSININYLARITPTTIWKAALNKHYAVVITGFMMFLAPLLTVVVSGLYIPTAVEEFDSGLINILTTINNTVAWTNPNGTRSPQDANAVSTLITEANLSFPAWTYDGYVLPILDTETFLWSEYGTNFTTNTTTALIELPVFYATLNCTHASPDVTYNKSGNGGVSNVTVPVPVGCGDVCSNQSASSRDCDTSSSDVFNLTRGLYLSNKTSAYGVVHMPSDDWRGRSDHCPQLALVYGETTVDGTDSTILTIDAAVCSPVVYQVMANVTFGLPGFTIDSLAPDMSTKEVLAVGGNATIPLHHYLPLTNWGVDSFFGGLVPGRDGSAWGDFVGEENFTHFSSHVDSLYSIIYTQWLNLNGRVSPESDAEASVQALIMNPMRMRLKQSAIATRILEGLLAAITICLAVSFFLLDTKKLVPCNPCSIAATAALLVESNTLLRSVPGGAEWYDKKELRRKRVFSEQLYTLGWWEGIGGTKRFGVDVGDAHDEEEPASNG